MKIIISLFTILLSISSAIAQEKVLMQIDYSTDSKDLETILRFEQINLAKYTFSGDLKGKNYAVRINEYKEGELVKIDTMFYSSQDEYFRMTKDTLNITFITKNENDELVFELNGNGFSSPKMNYEILESNGRYAYKDFLSAASSESYDIDNQFPLFTIITPTVYEDGSKSYCRVAQSGIKSENLGKEFDIPHYFVVTMTIE
ncbi:hypothetical protein RM545_17080 [Zunongwangia sp. F260]|uniref:DUF3857 domain-containing protein n=1 Tax=Autumnicola lenta TaxID=3075593 RepID=A0ABU3CPW8_9FLAO|nr:hypothetical protein [Zunongwangia sp. F260]MDT0648408.1 hypothetical protein [Zunongwangia sp. F260]